MTDREKRLLWKVCRETDKLSYPTPGAEETRERLLKIMDTLEERQVSCGMVSPPAKQSD